MSLSALSRLRANDGLTIIEVVTSFTIVMMGIFGALHMHLKAMDGLRFRQEEALAIEALTNEIEVMRAMPFEQLAATESAPFTSDATTLQSLHHNEPSVIIRDSGTTGLREVTARVEWIATGGRVAVRELTTYITDKKASGHAAS